MGLLNDKTILVTGIYRDSSIAYRVAELAIAEGATVIASGYGKRKRVTEATLRRLPTPVPVVEFDAREQQHVTQLADKLRQHTEHLDGIVHCISQSWPQVVGDHFMTATYEDVSHSLQVSGYSYVSLVQAVLPLLRPNSSVVGCTIDAQVAWPLYGWAGVAKAMYESENKYLAKHLAPFNVRANLVAAGPYLSFTAREVQGVDEAVAAWSERAPLAWNPEDATPIAQTMIALLSDWFPSTTGDIIHCDGGFHAIGY